MDKQKRKTKLFYIFSLVLFLYSFTEIAYSQPNIKIVEYSIDFNFKDGIYHDINEFLANSPSITKEYLVKENQGAQIWFGEYVKSENVYVPNSSGDLQKVRKKNVWGFCDNNKVYIYIDGNFHRIIQFGQISKIMYSRNQYYLPGYKVSKVNNPVKQKEYVLDIKGGQVFEFDFCKILKIVHDNDVGLFNEFISGDKQLQKLAKNHMDESSIETMDFDVCSLNKKKYYYKFSQLIRDYNKRNPLYFKQLN